MTVRHRTRTETLGPPLMANESKTTNPFAALEIAEFEQRHPVPSWTAIAWDFVTAALSIVSAVGGALYLSHFILGWPR